MLTLARRLLLRVDTWGVVRVGGEVDQQAPSAARWGGHGARDANRRTCPASGRRAVDAGLSLPV